MRFDIGFMIVLCLCMLRIIVILSLSGLVFELVIFWNGYFLGKGILKDIIVLKVDGVVRVIIM